MEQREQRDAYAEVPSPMDSPAIPRTSETKANLEADNESVVTTRV